MVFSGQEAMLSTVRAAGFAALSSGGPTLAEPGTRNPLLPLDRSHEERVIRDVFAGRTARQRIPALLDVADRWRPDVVVRDEVDFGAAVAAESLGLPHVSIIVLAAGGLIRPAPMGHARDELRSEHGLPPDPSLVMLHRHLTLVPDPPSYRTPADPLPATAVHIRPAALEPVGTAPGLDESTARGLTFRPGRTGRGSAVHGWPQAIAQRRRRARDRSGSRPVRLGSMASPPSHQATAGPVRPDIHRHRQAPPPRAHRREEVPGGDRGEGCIAPDRVGCHVAPRREGRHCTWTSMCWRPSWSSSSSATTDALRRFGT